MATIEELIEWDRIHLIHTDCPVGQNAGKIFEKGNGVIVTDAEGKEYIDLCSQLDCVSLGHSQTELVNAAAEQMQKLPYSTTFFGFSHRPSIECGMKLAELTPEGLDHFFFTSGGSESTETAFRLARTFWSRKCMGKYKIVSLYNSYHGTTIAAGSASGIGKGHMLHGIVTPAPGFIHIPPYYCYRCMFGKVYPSCNIQCAQFLADIIENEGPDTVAAFIAEPVIGAGGMIPPPQEYWPMVAEICRTHDVLLIADEVKTGFCRTGKMFALEHWGIEPDIMTMAKGMSSSYLPVGGVAFNEKVYEGVVGEEFTGFTYDGHPVGLVVATKAMEIYVRDKIADHASRVGKYLLDRLNAEFKSLPCIGEISGLGLMAGMEIVADKTSRKIFDPALGIIEQLRIKTFENGLNMRIAGTSYQMSDRVMFGPPLIITEKEIDRALHILKPIIADLKPAMA